MADQTPWCVSLGRWGGISVRLHGLFLLFAAVTAYLAWLAARDGAPGDLAQLTLLSLLVLLASVALHEIGHVAAALRLGVRPREVMLGPLGGLSPVARFPDPRVELVATLAGPLANLAVCLALLPAVLALDEASFLEHLRPLAPLGIGQGVWWHDILRLAFWLNWVLLLVNLLPAFPFDGGVALRSGLALWRPELGGRRASLIVARAGKIASGLLLLAAWLSRQVEVSGVAPPWFALLLLAIFLYFSAQLEERRTDAPANRDEAWEHELEPEALSVARRADPPRESGVFRRWLAERQEAKRRQEELLAAADEQRVDEVLARLHEQGLDRLSADDRALLERVSARYRSRLTDRA